MRSGPSRPVTPSAGSLIELASSGFGGCTVSFVDYLGELPHFVSEVFPRLEAARIRTPRS